MKLRSMLSIGFAALLATALLGLGGCDPADFGQDKVAIKDQKGELLGVIYFDINGNNNFNSVDDGDVPLAGVKVTMTDSSGEASSATTDAGGYYDISGLAEDMYDISYVATGYETANETIEVGFSPEIDNVSIREPLSMSETFLTAGASWAGGSVAVKDHGLDPEHGVTGASIVYTVATDGDITVVFSQAVTSGSASVDNASGSSAFGIIDTAVSATTFKILETAINGEVPTASGGTCSSGCNITVGTATTQFGNNTLTISGSVLTPIHKVQRTFTFSPEILVK